MKKILFVFAVILLFNQNIYSQDEKKVTIQTNPLLFFSDIFSDSDNDMLIAMDLEAQFKLTDYSNFSLLFSFLYGEISSYYSMPHYLDDDDYYIARHYTKDKVVNINLKPMFIYRPFGTGISGFYLGFYPIVGFYISNNEYKDQSFATEIGFGMNVGYKWVFKRGFTMQIGGGLGRSFFITDSPEYKIPITSDGRLRAGTTDVHLLDFKIGYSF